jgi:hypothetical protein
MLLIDLLFLICTQDWTKLEKMIASLAQDVSLLKVRSIRFSIMDYASHFSFSSDWQHGQEALRLDMHVRSTCFAFAS